MAAKKPTLSSDEFSRRGTEIYGRAVRPAVRQADHGKFVAIDIDSGAFEMDVDDYAATERLLAAQPQAQIWIARVGQSTAYRIGGAVAAGGSQ